MKLIINESELRTMTEVYLDLQGIEITKWQILSPEDYDIAKGDLMESIEAYNRMIELKKSSTDVSKYEPYIHIPEERTFFIRRIDEMIKVPVHVILEGDKLYEVLLRDAFITRAQYFIIIKSSDIHVGMFANLKKETE